jgi:glycine/D-amino acid oxidase-like deaminating enzyme
VKNYDVAIIGGGYYGSFIAYSLAEEYPQLSFAVIEMNESLFQMASSTNQGQLHMGYVYSGDETLANDCIREEPVFAKNFPEAVDFATQSYYGIHRSSEVSPADYEKFCQRVGLPLKPVRNIPRDIFSADIMSLYSTPEKTFNSAVLQKIMKKKLDRENVEIINSCKVERIQKISTGLFELECDNRTISASVVFNSSFAGMNDLHDRSGISRISMRYDSFLHFLIKLPEQYKKISMSVVRGQYCFVVPSEFRGGHLFASAEYRRVGTSVTDSISDNITESEVRERYQHSIDSCKEYLPILNKAEYMGYTFGVRVAYYIGQKDTYTSKVVLLNDHDDLRGYHVLLGGKVSALYDALPLARHTMQQYISAVPV